VGAIDFGSAGCPMTGFCARTTVAQDKTEAMEKMPIGMIVFIG
jgi:hypothetical protein